MRVNAYAAPAPGQPLAPTTVERRAVGPNDVLIEIQYAGICHSDIHTVNGDWGPQPFPVVPGHEIVGIVTEGVGLCQRRGGPVEVIRPGDRVLFEADEEHWHGATPDRFMAHVAIQEADDQGQVVTWLDHVTDQEYGA